MHTVTRKRRQGTKRAWMGCVIMLLAAGCSAGSGDKASKPSSAPSSPGASTSTASTGALNLQAAYQSVVRNVLPSVVQIQTPVGLGSGVIFDAKGNIVTNAHVVGKSTTFQVTLANAAKPVAGTLVGTYPADDLAVIHVDAGNLRPATFGDSTKLSVGDIVLAMGNPLGLSSSVTNGIISAVGRTVSEPPSSDSPGATLPNVIQTSAAINPGNSGGALVDLHSHVIGIPTLAAEDPAQGQTSGGAAPGIGFAIPSSIVTDIAGQLIKSGRVTDSHRAALNIAVTGIADPYGNAAGVGIVKVTQGGAAQQAGLQPGDIITAIDGRATSSPSALAQVLAQLSPGQTVTVAITDSSGNQRKVHVTLGQLPG